MTAVLWALVTFTGFSIAYTAPDDPAQLWGGSAVTAVAFFLLVCKIAGVRARDVTGAVRRAWRW